VPAKVSISAQPQHPPRPAGGRPAQALRPVAGVLPDGTPFYAPMGEVASDGDLVTCHLCGRSRRSVTAHLRAHGWTKAAYCEAFGLERGQSLEGQDTQKRRAAAFTPRLVFDPAIRAGSAAGRQRARSGDLSRDAVRAVTGRPVPEQRRRKAAVARAAMPPERVARANRDRAARHLAEVAAALARLQGYPDLRAFVLARAGAGASLAAISREAGLHQNWLARHLAAIDPGAAEVVRQFRPDRSEARWRPLVAALGFAGPAEYLRDRHVRQHRTVAAIAAEIGMSHHAVEAALARHGLAVTADAARRSAARTRAAGVAAALGYDSIGSYISDRRAAGRSWRAIAAESGQPATWLRRQHAAAR
jgi:hypothetical protein